MAKRLKEGRDARGFAIEEESGEKGVGEERKKKETQWEQFYTHLQNSLIPKKRQH